jgi:uncharacterized protein (TIGR02271 family)
MANPTAGHPSLLRLSDADYEVAPGEPDVRGWDVCLANDQKIGDVDDLIIDPTAGKVRYLDVDLDSSALQLERNRHVLVPIAGAQLDTEEEEVLLAGMSREALLRLPDYDGKAFDATYDDTFRSHQSEDVETKRLTRSAEELRIGKRMAQEGEVRISKHVETEHVSQNVPFQSEEVRVERRRVDREGASAADIREDEIRVPVMQEEAVVEKRPVVKEEIVITKQPKTVERTVEADVRREEVDVTPSSANILFKDDAKERGSE